MIILNHRILPGLGPYMDSWPKLVFFIAIIAVIAGGVAIWNRSRYHP